MSRWHPRTVLELARKALLVLICLSPLLPWYAYRPPLESTGGMYVSHTGRITLLKSSTVSGISFWEGGLILLGSCFLSAGILVPAKLLKFPTTFREKLLNGLQAVVPAWGGTIFFMCFLAMTDVTATSSMSEMLGGTSQTGRLSLNPNWFGAGIGLSLAMFSGIASLAMESRSDRVYSTWKKYWDQEQGVLQLLAVIGLGSIGLLIPVQWIHGVFCAVVFMAFCAMLFLKIVEGSSIQQLALGVTVVACLVYWWTAMPILSQRLHEVFLSFST